MSGRGDKGLLITTANFRPSAKAVATRDGAPPVNFIDGTELVELMRSYELGVKSVPRTVYDVEVVRSFFRTV